MEKKTKDVIVGQTADGEVVVDSTNIPRRKPPANKAKMQPTKSNRLISFREFFIGKPIRKETQAAIKMSLDGNLHHTLQEWNEILENFSLED